MFQLSCVLLSFLDHIVSFPNKWQIVPQSDERDSKEKTKSSSKVSDQRDEWVDQLLCLDCCLPRDCPPIKNIDKDVKKKKHNCSQGEDEVFRFPGDWLSCSNVLILPVLTRFRTAS